MRRARSLAAGLLVAFAVAAGGGAARAEIDYPVPFPLPDGDWSVGLTGAVAFDERDTAAGTGGLVGLDVGLLDGILGVHLGVRLHREGRAWRVGGLAEVSVWYVVLLGAGVRFGAMLDDGGSGVPDEELGLTVLCGIPFPVWRFDEGRGGALALVPYARPGLRFRGDDVSGFHELGVMVRWTSFGF